MNNDISMRILVMFDLPTNTKKERKDAARFRTKLQKLGFLMIQYSVYVRALRGIDKKDSITRKIKSKLPPTGNVRMLVITEKQYENMEILIGEPKSISETLSARPGVIDF